MAARPGHAEVIALDLAVARDRKDEPILQLWHEKAAAHARQLALDASLPGASAPAVFRRI